MQRLDWHTPIWKTLLGEGTGALSRLPHALLLHGRAGLGKLQFGQQFSRLLLCERPVLVDSLPSPCGVCEACRWFDAGSHPDFRLIAPESDEDDEAADGGTRKEKKKGARQITLDVIRGLDDFVFVGSHRHGRRVILVASADAMNPTVANAFLKVLEEPPPTVYLILVTDNPGRLLPTIVSRTRQFPFQRPELAEGVRWLAQNGLETSAERYLPLAGGAPLTVAAWKEQGQFAALDALRETLSLRQGDPLALAGQWDSLLRKHVDFSMEMLVLGVQRWLHDLALLASGQSTRFHIDLRLSGAASALSPVRLATAWRDMLRFRLSARHPLNQLLFLEDMAVHVLRGVSSEGSRT
jgi:DNA polymerase III subunit delta'